MQKLENEKPHLFILCGGNDYVERFHLPMAPLARKSLLAWTVENAVLHGFKRITLCVGHAAGIIIHNFTNGEKLGAEIDYSQDGGELGSGGALKKALIERPHLEQFLVIDINRFLSASLTEFLNQIYKFPTSSNPATVALSFRESIMDFKVKLDSKTNALVSSSYSQSDEGYSPAGFYIAHRSIINLMPDGPFSLNRDLLSQLIERNMAEGVILSGNFRYLKIDGEYQKLFSTYETNPYHKKKAVLFLDRDGVIIEDKHYLKDPGDVELLPNIADVIMWAKDNEMKVICLTNQAGIAKGYFTVEDHERVMERVAELLAEKKVQLDDHFFCPFHPKGQGIYQTDSLLRKAHPGMAILAAQKYPIDFSTSIMVGDKSSDVLTHLPLKTFILKGKYEIKEAHNELCLSSHRELLVKLRTISKERAKT